MKSSKKGFAHFIAAFGYTLAGLKAALVHEAAFRQDVVFALANIVAAWLLAGRIGTAGAVILSALAAMVCIVELLNSAIEAVVDLESPESHELAKRAKDMGSAAVGLSIGLVVAAWIALLALPNANVLFSKC